MMAVLRLYGRILSPPGAFRLVASSLLGRLPLGMTALATLLLLRREHFDFAVAGTLVALVGVGQAVASPVLGRLIDQRGAGKVLVITGLLFPAAVGVTAWVILVRGPLVVLGTACFLSGATIGPLGASLRTVWPTLLGDNDLRRATYTAEATFQELTYLLAPVLATGLSALWSPVAAFGVAATCGAAGMVWFGTAPQLKRERSVARSRLGSSPLGPLRVPQIQITLLLVAFLGASWGGVQLGVTQFAEQRGAPVLGGLALTAFGLGSLVGGLLSASSLRRGAPAVRALMGAAGLSCCLALTPVIGSPVVLTAVLFLAGIPNTVMLAALYTVIGTRGPESTRTEAFAWTTSVIFLGGSVGMLLAGHLAATGGFPAVLLASALFTVGCVVVAGLGWRLLGGSAHVD
jgi:MFS family permease